jgi:3D-(3,5/4)-trihydroxycyclohexane-1,2-dione acylhydrolase (decyclizing)
LLKTAKKPLIIAGGGVLYSEAEQRLAVFAQTHGIPVAETQGGKSSLPADHALNMGAIGVTGTAAANALAEQADVVLAIGTRLQDFTTGSWSLFKNADRHIVALNVQPFDAAKHRALSLVCDARAGLEALDATLGKHKALNAWTETAKKQKARWIKTAAGYTAPTDAALPSDAQVVGAVQRQIADNGVVVCAAGGLPGELHKLWNAPRAGGYHLEYGYSCMGYEIAGGLGVKMADPTREVVVMVGDGSYLMMNSEIATSIMLGLKLTIVVLDNRGFGCINRLQRGTGGESFNNLLQDTRHQTLPEIDFARHAASLGAVAEKVSGIVKLERALKKSRDNDRTTVLVIDTDPLESTDAGGTWWDVAVPEVSKRKQVRDARKAYVKATSRQRLVD